MSDREIMNAKRFLKMNTQLFTKGIKKLWKSNLNYLLKNI